MNLPFPPCRCSFDAVPRGLRHAGKPPPSISLDEPVQAQPLPEPPAPVEVVAVPNRWRCRRS
jgi:type IV secretion system protein VirB9